MKIPIDDWQFVHSQDPGCILTIDLFLTNQQHARLEVFPLINPMLDGDQMPELMVTGELPGEHFERPGATRRWLTRAPDPASEWSKVVLNEALVAQINSRLAEAIPAC